MDRDPQTGAMRNKSHRRSIFLDKLLPNHCHENALKTYDIYFFDFIGQQSQGCCISRQTHTVIMGYRSTKGYTNPTVRPLHCLAKTAAHELGHALSLDHPFGQVFQNGDSKTKKHCRDNLMRGGRDVDGGGGNKLEDWQVLVSRKSAMDFLSSIE